MLFPVLAQCTRRRVSRGARDVHSARLLLLSVAWRALHLRDHGVRPPSLNRPLAPVAALSGFGSPVLRGDQFLGAVGHIFISFGALFTGVPSTCAAHVPPSAVQAMSADGVHTAARIAVLLQQPQVLAALGAALAPFLARQAGDAGQQAPHAAAAARAARAGHSRSRGPQGVA